MPTGGTRLIFLIKSQLDYMQALPQAIAAVRDASGHSFPEAAEALLEHLDHVDNSGNPYSDDNAIAALLDALGSLHLQSHDVSNMQSIHALMSPCTLSQMHQAMVLVLFSCKTSIQLPTSAEQSPRQRKQCTSLQPRSASAHLLTP